MLINDIEVRIEQLVSQAQTAINKAQVGPFSTLPAMDSQDWAALRAGGLAFLEGTFGCDHSYYREFDKRVASSWQSDGKYALGILTAVRDHIKGGWLEKTKGLVTAEVFADFLEMADHLLTEKYKDPSAVLVGSVLEEHLRQLCQSASLPIEDSVQGKTIPLKADRLNSDLAKASKYSKLDQKSITAWLDLRNNAAHGKYAAYTHEQVALMLAGVRDFISRVRP